MTDVGQGLNRWRRAWWLSAAALALMAMLALAGCSLSGGTPSGGNSNVVALAQLPWCDRPLISFQDDSTTAQTTIASWSAVKDQIGFTPYLPPTLPKGSCLALAGGSIHDPIFGGRFSITYSLPQTGALSFSEAPKRANVGGTLQCVSSAQDAKTTICQGVMDSTSITLAGHQTSADLQTIFHSLAPNVDWVPPSPTPTPTATVAATSTAASK